MSPLTHISFPPIIRPFRLFIHMEKQVHSYQNKSSIAPCLVFLFPLFQLTDQCGCTQMASLMFSTQVMPEHLCRLNASSQIHTSLLEVSLFVCVHVGFHSRKPPSAASFESVKLLKTGRQLRRIQCNSQ